MMMMYEAKDQYISPGPGPASGGPSSGHGQQWVFFLTNFGSCDPSSIKTLPQLSMPWSCPTLMTIINEL